MKNPSAENSTDSGSVLMLIARASPACELRERVTAAAFGRSFEAHRRNLGLDFGRVNRTFVLRISSRLRRLFPLDGR